MNDTARAHAILRGRRATIAARWQQALAATGHSRHCATAVRDRLLALTDGAVGALFAEPFAPEAARAIGAGVAGLHYLAPDALAGTHAVLAEELLAGLPDAAAAALRPRLMALLGEVVAGFYAGARDTILAEQAVTQEQLLDERRRMLAALGESEARFRAVFADAAIGIALADAERRILAANPALQRLIGYSEAELRGVTFPAVTHPDDAAKDVARYRELVAGRRDLYRITKRYRHRDGPIVWGRLTVAPVRDAAGAFRFAIGMVEDITARLRAEEDGESMRRRLATVREEERLRLSHDLHDEAVQALYGLRFSLLAAKPALPAGAAPTLDAAAAQIVAVAARVHGIAGELRAPALDDHGLPAALASYADQLRQAGAAGTAIALDLDPGGATLPGPLAVCLYRVAQEALRNALAHAGATRVAVRLRLARGAATLSVRDDGRGFAVPRPLTALTWREHYGLAGMAERAAELDGRFAIRSRPGLGTTIVVRLPLSTDGGGGGDDRDDPRADRR
jgi:PAS domain S-box-containing protein